MALQPTHDRVLATLAEEKQQTDSGIILTASPSVSTIMLNVVAVGEDCKEVKASDCVVIQKNAGARLNCEGVNYIVVRESEILAICN